MVFVIRLFGLFVITLNIRKVVAMKSLKRMVGAFSIATAGALAGCGSGYVETAAVVPSLFANVQFALDVRVNGVFLPELGVEAGYEQDVLVQSGSTFEVLASGPVQWTVTIDGTTVNPPLGTGVVFNGVSLVPTAISSGRFSAVASTQGFLARTPVISIIATSVVDNRQDAAINVLLTR
jgi:hypothetical protein